MGRGGGAAAGGAGSGAGGSGFGIARSGNQVIGGDVAGLVIGGGNLAVAELAAEHGDGLAVVEGEVGAGGLGGADLVEEGPLGIDEVGLAGMGAGAAGGGTAGEENEQAEDRNVAHALGRLELQLRYSRGSVIFPVKAEAATV